MDNILKFFHQTLPQATPATILITALITASVTLVIQKAGAAILGKLTQRAGELAERFYWAFSPLRTYRKHLLRSDLTRIENPIGPTLEVPLETAFAPLKLLSSNSQDPIDLFGYTATQSRFIVLGGPGTGKTTLMKSLVVSIAKGKCDPRLNGLIPVFVTLRKLAKANHDIKQAIVSAMDAYHFPSAERFVHSALAGGKLLIVLDGLDEVGTARGDVAGRIQEFCRWDSTLATPNHIVITCREASYRTEDLREVVSEVLRVEPFSNHHMKVFLNGWPVYRGRVAARLYNDIQRDAQIRDICRNPLLLTILVGLFLETEHFELPSSRERFYGAAVRELMVNRPARRGIPVHFQEEIKRKLLEVVALTRLDQQRTNEDPEEIPRSLVEQLAGEALSDKTTIAPFMTELIETHGILKESREGAYVFAHRTIQEYFAARESIRSRRPEQVIDVALARKEFGEVLAFYCGLNRNIETLDSILGRLVEAGEWLVACRCLLNMTEVPATRFITDIAAHLADDVRAGHDTHLSLELLVALSHRASPAFSEARNSCQQAIDAVVGNLGGEGPGTLCSALSATPEAAMQLIPALLAHRQLEWRSAAYRLLRDIGTPEALDQLVQSIGADNPDRSLAAIQLLSLLPSRHKELTDRAGIFAPRRDEHIWPLERHFPGAIVLPLVEALADVETTGVAVVDYSLKASRIRAGKVQLDNRFMREWQSLPRDLRINSVKQSCETRCKTVFKALYAFVFCGILGGAVGAFASSGEWLPIVLAGLTAGVIGSAFGPFRTLVYWVVIVLSSILALVGLYVAFNDSAALWLVAIGLTVALVPAFTGYVLRKVRWPQNDLLPSAISFLAEMAQSSRSRSAIGSEDLGPAQTQAAS
jgi:hypothetical protein